MGLKTIPRRSFSGALGNNLSSDFINNDNNNTTNNSSSSSNYNENSAIDPFTLNVGELLVSSWVGDLLLRASLVLPPLPIPRNSSAVNLQLQNNTSAISTGPPPLSPAAPPSPPFTAPPAGQVHGGRAKRKAGAAGTRGGRGRGLREAEGEQSLPLGYSHTPVTVPQAKRDMLVLEEDGEEGVTMEILVASSLPNPHTTRSKHWATAAATDAAHDLLASLSGLPHVPPPPFLIHSAWKNLLEAATRLAVQEEETSSSSSSSSSNSAAAGANKRTRGRSLAEGDSPSVDTYAGSLVTTNRLLSHNFGRKVRKVPAHMPHMIDKIAMGKLQEKYAQAYAETAARKFRTTMDVQYAFAYFHFLLEGGAREGLDVGGYFSLELDADGDGILSENELRTLGAVVYKRTPTREELVGLRACLVGSDGEKVTLETTSISRGSGKNKNTRTVEVIRVVEIKEVTWDTIMNCPLVVESLAKNARFGPTAQDMGSAANEEVAFEMVGDDYNKTVEQLDAIRAKRPKFVCLNDNMKIAHPTVIQVLKDFLDSYYAKPSPMERTPQAGENPVLYIGPLREALRMERLRLGATYTFLAVILGGLLVWLGALWAERIEGREGRRGESKKTPTPSYAPKRAGSTPKRIDSQR